MKLQEQPLPRQGRRDRVLAAVARLPRVQLAHLPTPLEELPRLSKVLSGPQIFMKRDDLTGLALGGNKARMLEFYLADALAQGADVIVSGASVQSNLCRQVAAAAAHFGLSSVLLLRGVSDAEVQGNLLLDCVFGAEIRPVRMDHLTGIWDLVEQTAADLRSQGRRAYPLTTFEPLGAVAYVDAACEIDEQCEALGITPTWLITSAAGGGTQAGLVLGTRALHAPWQVLGVAPIVWQDRPMHERIAGIADGAARLLGLGEQVVPEDIANTAEYVGRDYGVPTRAGLEAMRLVARTEGILLDPVYTSKAMAGLIDKIERGVIGRSDVVVFLHTGGVPALFAYSRQVAEAMGDGPCTSGRAPGVEWV